VVVYVNADGTSVDGAFPRFIENNKLCGRPGRLLFTKTADAGLRRLHGAVYRITYGNARTASH